MLARCQGFGCRRRLALALLVVIADLLGHERAINRLAIDCAANRVGQVRSIVRVAFVDVAMRTGA